MSAVSVVVVAYGNPELLEASLMPLTCPVIVVDNSSSVAVRNIAVRHGAAYLDPGDNLGFGAGVNRGVAEVDPTHDILVLNPDAVLAPRDLCRMVAELERRPDLAVIAPQLVDPLNHPQRVLWPFPSPARMWREAFGLGRLNDRRSEWVAGAVMLIRRAAWEGVGPFDERFFLYQEETDWQRRAVQQGWAIAMARNAVAQHVGAGTSSDPARREAMFHAGTETYVRKWFGSLGWLSYRLAAITGALLRSILLCGDARRVAWRRADIYLRGPRRFAGFE